MNTQTLFCKIIDKIPQNFSCRMSGLDFQFGGWNSQNLQTPTPHYTILIEKKYAPAKQSRHVGHFETKFGDEPHVWAANEAKTSKKVKSRYGDVVENMLKYMFITWLWPFALVLCEDITFTFDRLYFIRSCEPPKTGRENCSHFYFTENISFFHHHVFLLSCRISSGISPSPCLFYFTRWSHTFAKMYPRRFMPSFLWKSIDILHLNLGISCYVFIGSTYFICFHKNKSLLKIQFTKTLIFRPWPSSFNVFPEVSKHEEPLTK